MKGVILRGAYAVGVCSALVMGASAEALAASMGFPPPMLAAVKPAMWFGFLLVAGVTLLLTVRPYWWGKLFLLWPGLSWLGFTGAMTFITGWSEALWIPVVCGGAMLLLAVAHQLIDPRFSGPPLQ